MMREPGRILAIWHPLRRHKVPRGIVRLLREAGYDVREVETLAERTSSVRRLAAALRDAHEPGVPLDVVVFTGDSSLDHHVVTAAYLAFFPDQVAERPGEITVRDPGPERRASLPAWLRAWLEPLPDPRGWPTTEAAVRERWLQRAEAAAHLRRGAGAPWGGESERFAAFATCFPDCVTLRADGFDLSRLGAAGQPALGAYLRSIVAFPAGTAADNALYAGIPGWAYAQGRWLVGWIPGVRRAWERRLVGRVVDTLQRGTVVPARHSVVGLDGAWQLVSSHATGGPASGRFFEADLSAHTGGLLGYLARIPAVVLGEGVFGSTFVRVEVRGVDGQVRHLAEGRLVEGLYTNRAFVAGIGSVPSTNAASRGGASTFVVAPPLWFRDRSGALRFDASGLLTFGEAIVRGLVTRMLRAVGVRTGPPARAGAFAMARAGNQMTLVEGESVSLRFTDPAGHPRFVPVQVSGEPCQAHTLEIRVAWGALPLLAAPGSLLLEAAAQVGGPDHGAPTREVHDGCAVPGEVEHRERGG